MFKKDIMLEFNDVTKSHLKDVELEIEAIKHSFSNTIKQLGPNSYKPFAVFFSDPETKSFVISSRNILDEKDYYTAISEMLFTYSSTDSEALLFALDASKQISGVDRDVLEVYMACDHFCNIYTMPYELTSDNTVVWLENQFSTSEIEKLDQTYDTTSSIEATIEIIEALFLHTHMNNTLFDMTKLKSYFDTNGFEYIDLSKNSENKISLFN